jgi:hypothetical protein
MAIIPGGLHTPHRDFGEDESESPKGAKTAKKPKGKK